MPISRNTPFSQKVDFTILGSKVLKRCSFPHLENTFFSKTLFCRFQVLAAFFEKRLKNRDRNIIVFDRFQTCQFPEIALLVVEMLDLRIWGQDSGPSQDLRGPEMDPFGVRAHLEGPIWEVPNRSDLVIWGVLGVEDQMGVPLLDHFGVIPVRSRHFQVRFCPQGLAKRSRSWKPLN